MGLITDYNPDTDIPDLSGKVFFITGGTAGIGKSAILNLAKHNPSAIYFTGRNTKKAELVLNDVKTINPAVSITFYECDLSSLSSVEAVGKHFLNQNTSRLDVLICNAGIMGTPPDLSKDGFEIQFATNFLSHALLTKLFLPLLSHTASTHGEARILSLTSEAMYVCPSDGVILSDLRSTQENLGFSFLAKWTRYGQSKMAQTLYTRQLAERYPAIISIAVNPGVINTGLINNLAFYDRMFIKLATWGKGIELHQGPWNTLWAATSGVKDMRSGKAYSPVGVELELKEQALDERLAERLWEWTEETLKEWK